MNTVLTRSRFYSTQVALFASCVATSLLASHFVDQIDQNAWLSSAVSVFAVVLARLGLELLTGGEVSYRKYVASHGGELVPPSRFWATTGQAVVCILAAAVVGAVSYIASGAPADSNWRGAAMVVWPVVVGSTLIYLLVARDWRRELRHRRMLPNETLKLTKDGY